MKLANTISLLILTFSVPSSSANIFVWLAVVDGNDPLATLQGMSIAFFATLLTILLCSIFTNIFQHFGFIKKSRFVDEFQPVNEETDTSDAACKIGLAVAAIFLVPMIVYLITITVQMVLPVESMSFRIISALTSGIVTFLLVKYTWKFSCAIPSSKLPPNVR